MGEPTMAVRKLSQLWRGISNFWRPLNPASLAVSGFVDLERVLTADERSFVKDSYPHNHTFIAMRDQLLPTRKLARRVSRLSRFYLPNVGRIVDLSCSKGFFVFHAASRPDCQRALGIDLDESCLEVCRTLNACFTRQSRVSFARLTLSELAEQIDSYGGPFQTALLVNTYQYLLFGSLVAPPIGIGHRDIFRLLRRICDGRIIFHNRLHLWDLQHDVIYASRQVKHQYDPAAIFEAATEFFSIRRVNRWSRRPVWVLDARREPLKK